MSPRTRSRLAILWAISFTITITLAGTAEASEWISALDEQHTSRTGNWTPSRFRFAAVESLQTDEDRAHLVLSFEGTGLSIRLGAHNVPAYTPVGPLYGGRVPDEQHRRLPASLWKGKRRSDVVNETEKHLFDVHSTGTG